MTRHSTSFMCGLPRVLTALVAVVALACSSEGRSGTTDSVASTATDDTLRAAVITDTVANDSDDPAIWIDTVNPANSLILGTDKGDSTGGVYVFGLDGRIDTTRTRRPMLRPNNVDAITGLTVGGKMIDIAVAAERGRMALRVFQLPEMTPIDNGGIPVFDGDTTRAPMGVALYKRASDGAVFAIVGGKSGPTDGYLWQYRLEDAGNGSVRGTKVRAFGAFSGTKEIEAITVDQSLGYVFYSDETVGIRKYHADPVHPDAARELALFATTGFVQDHEGLAIYPTSDSTGFLIASDQQGQRIQLFRREGSAGKPHDHVSIATIPVSAKETDGLEVTAKALSPSFPEGALVMMSTDRTFHIFDWREVRKRLPQ